MKLISLNLWCGIVYEPLMEFIRRQSADTDIFCFQEMIEGGPEGGFGTEFVDRKIRGRLFEEISAALPDFVGYFYPGPEGSRYWSEDLESVGGKLGLALFVRRAMEVKEAGGMTLYDGDPFRGSLLSRCTGSFQYAVLSSGGKQYVIGNVHGLMLELSGIVPNPGKRDTPERIEQSRRLIEFFKKQPGSHILAGDFNMRPETESIAMLGRQMRNLIAEYGITITRNAHYTAMDEFKDYISDYAFVSRDIALKDFKVLPDIISDHAPLILEF